MVTGSELDVEVTVVDSRMVVDIAVMLFTPEESTAVVHCHRPVVSEVMHGLPVATPFAYNCTVDPTGAEPLKVGVVSLVLLSVVDDPVSDASSRSGVVTSGSV
jgi:hypothetical protein